AVDLLDDEALLIHFDGKDRRVAIVVVVLRDRLGERIVQMLQAVRQDIGEAHHHRRSQVASLQALHDLIEVDVPSGLRVGSNYDVTGRVDAEVTLAPRIDVVEVQGVLDAPGLGGIELASAVQGALRIYGHVRESSMFIGENRREIFARPYTFSAGQGTALTGFFIGENRRDDFRETLHSSPRARERPWPGFSLAKIVETISARPYAFRRGPGNGPGQVFHWRKSSRRFPRDPTHFAAGQGTALARYSLGTSLETAVGRLGSRIHSLQEPA